MAYKIRYGPEKPECGGTLLLRLTGAAGLLAGVLLLRWLWPEGWEAMQGLLSHAPATELEQATAAFADAVTAGKGWYDGFAVFAAMRLS